MLDGVMVAIETVSEVVDDVDVTPVEAAVSLDFIADYISDMHKH